MPCRVKGKLPGNIDLIVRAIATDWGGYIHDDLLEWFEECQSTTINVRLLGVDKVSSSRHSPAQAVLLRPMQFFTMDSEHLKFLLVTGHTNFSRGDTQKELL